MRESKKSEGGAFKAPLPPPPGSYRVKRFTSLCMNCLSSRLKRRGLVAIGLHLGETLANNEGSPIEAAETAHVELLDTTRSGLGPPNSNIRLLCCFWKS